MIKWSNHLPKQFILPSPVYPARQEHVCEVSVSVHVAMEWQGDELHFTTKRDCDWNHISKSSILLSKVSIQGDDVSID